tara:strand:- start:6317 stop:8929 length:2613 start_codon:yes stop_codon:yes gene_type:complete
MISSLCGINYNLIVKDKNLSNSRSIEFDTIIGLMVDFDYEEVNDPNTTGRGHFLNEIDLDLISTRCDGFLVDPPPHNADYFRDQIQAVKNYFSFNAHDSELDTFNFYVLDEVLHLNKPMRDYSVSDTTIGNLFSEAIDLALDESTLIDQDWFIEDEIENYLFVVFHAGVGQDISFPYIDPTNYDIPSAYIDTDMLNESWDYYNTIKHGIVMPETLNHIYYNIIEDLFYGNDNFCNYQLGMTGLFSLLVGYAMDLPVLYNTDNGEAGIGSFGLMDYGSNNGYGVIPSPISPWTKIYKGWSASDDISDFGQINLDTDDIKKINISSNEYLLIENKNNWVEENIDIDSLRNKYKVWDSEVQDSIPGYFFNILTERLGPDQISLSESTGVILGFDNYNYGLPGSGILIWSINEDLIDQSSVQSGMNNDQDNKAIEIIEADGRADIGHECYHWNPSFCDILSSGWEYDLWYSANGQYLINNPNENEIVLHDNTNPNLRLSNNALSLVELNQFSSISNSMNFNYSSYTPSLIVSNISPNSEIDVIGSSIIDGNGCLYYLENDNLYKRCFGESAIVVEGDFNPNEHSKILVYNNVAYAASENQYLLTNESLPVIVDGLDDLQVSGYFNSINALSQNNEAIAAADFDNDGLDEYVKVDSNLLYVLNSNNTVLDNFPIDFLFDDYQNNILIANIVEDSRPEIIFKGDGTIYIVSNNGQVYASIASNSQSKLRLLPNWGNNIALIDGSRLFLFPYDIQNTYWTSQYGTDWDIRSVDPNTSQRESTDILNTSVFYNYPNPIKNNSTTFRFFNSIGFTNPQIQIYNIEGFLVETIYPDSFQNIMNEYVEIPAVLLDYKPGVYFAELKDKDRSIAIIKVAITQ